MTGTHKFITAMRILTPIGSGLIFAWIAGTFFHANDALAFLIGALAFSLALVLYWKLQSGAWRNILFNISDALFRLSGYTLEYPSAPDDCADRYYALSAFLYDNGLTYSKRDGDGNFFYKVTYDKPPRKKRFLECVMLTPDGFRLQKLVTVGAGDAKTYEYRYLPSTTTDLNMIKAYVQRRLTEFKSHCDTADVDLDANERDLKAQIERLQKQLQEKNERQNNGGNQNWQQRDNQQQHGNGKGGQQNRPNGPNPRATQNIPVAQQPPLTPQNQP